MTHSVLFVCSMNVCRSPLMQWAFVEALGDASSTLKVASRGVSAARGNPICEQSGILMQGSEAGRRFAQTHASAPISPSDLNLPHLVIVATRTERSVLARYAPALRSSTFTLREANLLAAAPVTPREHASIEEYENSQGVNLGLYGFPHLLHRRRGTLVLPQPRTGGHHRIDPLDIPDAHLRNPASHGAMLRNVRTETRELVSHFLHFRERSGAIGGLSR